MAKGISVGVLPRHAAKTMCPSSIAVGAAKEA